MEVASSKVVKSCLSVPNGNAGAERSLSDNKNMLVSEQTNLKPKTMVRMWRAKEYARTYNVIMSTLMIEVRLKK